MVLLCLWFLLFLTSDQANKNRKVCSLLRGHKGRDRWKRSANIPSSLGKLLAGFPWLALAWPWADSSSASIVEIRGKSKQNISIVKQRAKPSRLFHPLSLILIDITSNLCRWTRSQPKIRYTSHIHNRCIFELIHRTDLVTHLCQGSELLRRKVRCCEAFKLECWN